jgi:hypothetical protein
MESNPYRSPGADEARVEPIAWGEPLVFSGRLTLADLERIGRKYTAARWQRRIVVALGLTMLTCLVGLFAWSAIQTGLARTVRSTPPLAIGGAVFAVLFIFAAQYWQKRKARGQSDREEGPYATRVFELGDEGLHVTAPNVESQFRWGGFLKCVCDDEYLALHLKPEGSEAIFFARRWFLNSERWARLCEYVRSRLPEG